MPISGIGIKPRMVYQYLIAIAIVKISCLSYYTIKQSRNTSAIIISKVNPTMKFPGTGVRIRPPAKSGCNRQGICFCLQRYHRYCHCQKHPDYKIPHDSLSGKVSIMDTHRLKIPFCRTYTATNKAPSVLS